ncbi:ATP-binding protein [Roseivirga sp. UBA1976]|uniref:ATP-binding protein n=1 Tax=Roseivirga sp. UBA1976 TaxID=1947386 RepID=UPI0025796C27|nr:ATP-binding protein [Roseivirga sp. UBA1976]|tara:strand:- start:2054 stop:3916 length:1863 start_codon:yes stop_codon:yes gene_type:complete
MKEYELNIDPRILELLGPNLYTNIYYVLAELIANAYDADAHNVYIIANPDNIRVEDDGHGMSYQAGEVNKYLNVAGESRSSEQDSHTRSGTRRKMGRKGVGKLAALSVSESVDILTISRGEKSGFVLTRRPEGKKLQAIEDGNIQFDFIKENGTAIVMKEPEYRLHSTLNAVKRNLLKIFPIVSKDFRVHIIRGKEVEIIEDFDRNIMKELCALITLGDEFAPLTELVPKLFESKHEELVESRSPFTNPIVLKNKDGKEIEYALEILGWIGTYISSRGRKAEMTDFPDNFISLFANGKLGEFNILPNVGSNKLNEVYVVGQLHVDLFELSELPDMALSNRQGYKSDDPRYEKVRDHIRSTLLPDILKRRELYSDFTKAKKKRKKLEEQKRDEERLRQLVDKFRNNISQGAAQTISQLGVNAPLDAIEAIIKESINNNTPELGLKSVVDSQKKKILISQTYSDKSLADIVYSMLNFNNVPSEDILYTNCDDEICRIPEGVSIYDYLRDFFVESYSTEKIYVLFITSENSQKSWGAITEVGASWITQIDHKIFNIPPFRPEHPLDDESQWHNTNRSGFDLSMSRLSADIFCQKIENLCDQLGYSKRTRYENKVHLATLVAIS